MINILFDASITGGIVVLLWYLSYPLSKKYFKASWHYIILKITMLFLILPLSILAPNFNNIISGSSPKPERLNISAISEHIQTVNINTETINSVLSNIIFPDNVSYTDNIKGGEIKNANSDFPCLQILWLTVSIVIFSAGARKMRRFKKQILTSSTSNVDRETHDLFLQCRKQLKVCGRIHLRTSEYIRTPLAFGLINPLVILPETDMNANEKRLAFIHELTHIKNGDLWLKFFASVISAFHWFNPLAHLLRRKISVISEEYCDECVVGKMEKEERLLYGSLILKVVSDISMPEFCSTLASSTKNIKRRLLKMINLKKSRKGIIALSIITAVILCSLATVYALSANEDIPEPENPAYNDYSYENILDSDIPEEVAPDSPAASDDYSYENISDADISKYVEPDSSATSFDATEAANDDSLSGWSVLGRDGQAYKVTSSNTKVLTYEEYVAFLEEYRIENADKTVNFTNGNGEESVLSADEAVEMWYSISEQVKNGTTQFKQVIVDGVVLAWGDWVD